MIRRAPFYPACRILHSSSRVQYSISRSSPMWPVGCCAVEPVFFCSSVMFAHPLPLILNTSSILLPIREVQRTQNDLFVRLRGRVYETREQKSHICNNRTNYEVIIISRFSRLLQTPEPNIRLQYKGSKKRLKSSLTSNKRNSHETGNA